MDQLEAVARGELRSLLVNAPPRTGKTLLGSVLFPAWIWAQSEPGPLLGPQVSFFCVSYSAILAEELAVRQRRLCFGDFYSRFWGHRVKLLPDQSSRANFANTAQGARVSTSVDSGLLGRGGDIQLLDDLMTVKEADSEIERQRILKAFYEGLPTRVTNANTCARVLIGQRVAEDDVSDAALKTWGSDLKHLMLPMRYESDRCIPEDMRTYDGQLLCPDLWSEEEVRKLELGLSGFEEGQGALSSAAVAAQLQQSPRPVRGGIVPRESWGILPLKVPELDELIIKNGMIQVMLPELSYVICAVDTAFSQSEQAAFSAACVYGLWSLRNEPHVAVAPAPWYAKDERWGTVIDQAEEASRTAEGDLDQPRVMLCEAFTTRAALNDMTIDPRTGKAIGLVQRLIDLCRRRKVDVIIVENANRGQDVMREIRRQMHFNEFDFVLFEPRKHGDKVNRMHSVSMYFRNGLIFAPGKLTRSFDKFGREESPRVEELRWVAAVMDQCLRTPRGQQDLADCTSMALLWLRDQGLLQFKHEFVRSQLEARAYRPKPVNIGKMYGVG